MNNLLESIFLVSSIIGILIGLALLSQIFTKRKANFFIGMVVLVIAFELLFSWGGQSGYNNTKDAFPIALLLNYLIIPPSIWIFIRYSTDDNFQFQPIHFLLFIPAVIQSVVEITSLKMEAKLRDNILWIWLSEYLPLIALISLVTYFWIIYFKHFQHQTARTEKKVLATQMRLLLLMVSLTFMGVFWLTFTFIGWKHFELIEYTIILLFFGFAFINFLDNQHFPILSLEDKNKEFSQYDDLRQLKKLENTLNEKKLFLKPNLPLKELSAELNLPPRYVSFLINHYHKKNYKEFINTFRIETFLSKAKSEEKDYKTLLGLAMESGFSSKSTFNLVFKKHLGQSPSEYLNKATVLTNSAKNGF